MRKLIIKIIKRQDGLTLVELLIILFLIVIVLSLGQLYYSYSVQALERGEKKTIAQQSTRSTSDFITREIRFAKEIEINPDQIGGDDYKYIYLQNDSIIFRDANGNERFLADSDSDGTPYSLFFTSNNDSISDEIPEDILRYYIIADYVLDTGGIEAALASRALEDILDEEAGKGLYFLKTDVIALNLELFRVYGPGGDLIEINEHGGTAIKYKKP